MSSVLEFGTEDAVFEGPNDGGSGLLIYTESDSPNFISNFISIGEDGTDPVGNDIVFGGNLLDFISTGDGDDIIDGGSGNDVLDGGSGNDIISGGSGNDVIDGGTGRDILEGGAGQDIFKFQLEDFQDGKVDKIQDFEKGVDTIQLGSDINQDLITIDGNIVKYDGQEVIEILGDEPDLEIF